MSEDVPDPEGVFDPERHQPLAGGPWDAALARTAIDEIVADFVTSRRADGSWPTHLLDGGELPGNERHWTSYFGAAGAVSSLRILRAAGYDAPDLSSSLVEIADAYRKEPDRELETGLQMGEIGILAPAVLADPSDRPLGDRLERAMEGILGHPAREITSGETGALHAALTLFRATADPRWQRQSERLARSLVQSWEERANGHWHWTSHVFGFQRSYYGACHGVAGNGGALLRALEFLPELDAETIVRRVARTLLGGALEEGEGLNWPVSEDASGTRRLVQWCHGAPGVVTALAKAPPMQELDCLLLRAGEFVWKAGPLRKGPGLCHGTAGNGYAFLGLAQRTGEARWLDRARVFAMHGVRQRRRARARYGQGRFTLWSGDGGLAVFLSHCLEPERTAFPGLELL
ncbi:MAG: LanC-like protein [Deltaproteobacteria bacterium]|nr:LanC-like protein [Deltaproteobacteria bacterium]